MASGADVRLGPWPDGINLLDKPDQLRDTQLLSCVNFDIDNTGVLEPRRGLRGAVNQEQASGSNVQYLLGTVTLDGDSFPRAVTGSYTGTITFFSSRQRGDVSTDIVALSSRSGLFKSIVQYQSKLWYIPGLSTSVGANTPANSSGTFTSVAAMPWGDYGFILKDRLFIVRRSTSEIFFSKATDFTVWAAPDGGVIQVNPGDNQPITKVVTINNQVIVFKRDSTFVLSFTASPTGDGVLRQVSADQGALDAITYNNEVYCYNSRSVFKFVNGFFQDIGLQLNLPGRDNIDASTTSPAKINVVGKTLIFGTTPAGNNYAMNLDTGAWTTYSLSGNQSISTGTVFSRSSVGTAIYFGDGTDRLTYMLVTKAPDRRTDQDSFNVVRAPAYSFRTKEYNFDDSETWKRVYSWHLDSTFDTAPVGSALTYINGTINNTTSDVLDLVGSSLSYRFKTTSMGYSAAVVAAALTDAAGPVVRGIRAVIGAKAPVSV